MIPYLLDVNVLLALCDPMHVHHTAARRWFNAKARAAWATCPITENGYVRIASQPKYPNRPGDPFLVLDILRQLCASGGHRFWPDNVSLRELVDAGAALTQRHITDVYLLGLAVQHGGRLATFDGRVPVASVRGGHEALEVIPA